MWFIRDSLVTYKGCSLAVTVPLVDLSFSSLSLAAYFYKPGRNIIIVENSQPVSNLVKPVGQFSKVLAD